MDFPDPWEDRKSLDQAALECRGVFERLLPKLSESLDQIHGESLGVRYWRFILGSWLLYHLQQLEDRRRRAEFLIEKRQGAVGLLAEEDFRVPRDTTEFRLFFNSTHYNRQLLTLCLRDLGVERRARGRKPELPKMPPLGGPRGWARSARDFAFRLGRRAHPTEILTDGLYPLGWRRHLLLSKALDFRLWPLAQGLPERLRVKAHMNRRRLSLGGLDAHGPLEKLAVASLPWCLPSLFLEGFLQARAYARQVLGPMPRMVWHTVGIYYDELYKLCAAEAARAGARVLGLQHGGQYGMAGWSNPEWFERSIADVFFTWGWTEDASTLSMPVPWLDPTPRRAPRPDAVLFISTSGFFLPHELFPNPLGRQFEAVFSWRERFIKSLSPRERALLRMRLFPVDTGWRERERLKAQFPDIEFDSSPFKQSVSSAALVITDHPGTTFLETLAWNVPGIHFWEDRLWASRPAAAKALEGLRGVGIVHDTPESASRQARSVLRDPSPWWRSPKLQQARREFLERYARVSPCWLSEWSTALRQELEKAVGAGGGRKC